MSTPRDPFSKIPFGPQRCRNVANHVLDAVEAELIAAAERTGGPLSLDDVHAALAEVRAAPRGMWNFYKDSFAGCFAASKAADPQGYERTDLFSRLIALCFESRFPDMVAPGDDGPVLPHTIVQPFIGALELMLGREALEAHHAICTQTYDELNRTLGDKISWSVFYDAPGSRTVLAETCRAIAPYFTDFDARMAWTVDVLNKNRGAVAAKNADGGVDDFTEGDVALLLTCLFAHGRRDDDAATKALLARLNAYDLWRYAS